MHCVITTRDCVMVEERRLSLAFLDEVKYLQARARRWCEPPVQYLPASSAKTLRDPAELRSDGARNRCSSWRVTREAMEKAENAAAGAFGGGDDGCQGGDERTGESLDDDGGVRVRNRSDEWRLFARSRRRGRARSRRSRRSRRTPPATTSRFANRRASRCARRSTRPGVGGRRRVPGGGRGGRRSRRTRGDRGRRRRRRDKAEGRGGGGASPGGVSRATRGAAALGDAVAPFSAVNARRRVAAVGPSASDRGGGARGPEGDAKGGAHRGGPGGDAAAMAREVPRVDFLREEEDGGRRRGGQRATRRARLECSYRSSSRAASRPRRRRLYRLRTASSRFSRFSARFSRLALLDAPAADSRFSSDSRASAPRGHRRPVPQLTVESSVTSPASPLPPPFRRRVRRATVIPVTSMSLLLVELRRLHLRVQELLQRRPDRVLLPDHPRLRARVRG